jgi:hypothetical protein
MGPALMAPARKHWSSRWAAPTAAARLTPPRAAVGGDAVWAAEVTAVVWAMFHVKPVEDWRKCKRRCRRDLADSARLCDHPEPLFLLSSPVEREQCPRGDGNARAEYVGAPGLAASPPSRG